MSCLYELQHVTKVSVAVERDVDVCLEYPQLLKCVRMYFTLWSCIQLCVLWVRREKRKHVREN